MYIPDKYKESDRSLIVEFLRENNFGILISASKQIQATHIPFHFEKGSFGLELSAHLSRANPQWNEFNEDEEVLIIFQGVHGYISSSWYDHENVPTWNYLAVHIRGNLKVLNEEETKIEIEKLMDVHEKDMKNPVSMDRFSDETLEQLRGVVGIIIQANSIEAKRKLSQNRDDVNFDRIIAQLEVSESVMDRELAKEMRKNRPKTSGSSLD